MAHGECRSFSIDGQHCDEHRAINSGMDGKFNNLVQGNDQREYRGPSADCLGEVPSLGTEIFNNLPQEIYADKLHFNLSDCWNTVFLLMTCLVDKIHKFVSLPLCAS